MRENEGRHTWGPKEKACRIVPLQWYHRDTQHTDTQTHRETKRETRKREKETDRESVRQRERVRERERERADAVSTAERGETVGTKQR